MSVNDQTKAAKAAKLLRTIKVGDQVRATRSAPTYRQGYTGIVTDTNPFEPDGIRRVVVEWPGDKRPSHVLPTSIEIVR